MSESYDRSTNRRAVRSGDFSLDLQLDPASLFEIIGASESAEQASSAIERFLDQGDEGAFAHVIAVYVRSARARGEHIEHVLATLNRLSVALQPRKQQDENEPTRLRQLVLRGVLLACYGDAVVAEYEAGRQRRHDASRLTGE